MDKHIYYVEDIDNGLSMGDILSLVALAISILSLIFSFYSIFLSKQIEIRLLQFNKLCIDPIDDYLNVIFAKIESLREDIQQVESIDKNYITNIITDLNTYLVSLSTIYPNIPTTILETITDEFSDSVYQSNSKSILKLEFYKLKGTLTSILLNYAIIQELSIVKRLWFKYFYSHLKKIPLFRNFI